MVELFLSNRNLQDFINSLKIREESRKFLLEELPLMDRQERFELLGTLEKIYILNQEEKSAIERVKKNWEEVKA